MIYRLLIAALCIAGISACRQGMCVSYGVAGVMVSKTDGSNLADTMIKVVRYRKNSGFTGPLDSFVRRYVSYPAEMSVIADTISFENYNYDLLCTLYPTGKVYRITDIWHENDKTNPGPGCVNPVHYTVNGVAMTIKGYVGMGGFMLSVPY